MAARCGVRDCACAAVVRRSSARPAGSRSRSCRARPPAASPPRAHATRRFCLGIPEFVTPAYAEPGTALARADVSRHVRRRLRRHPDIARRHVRGRLRPSATPLAWGDHELTDVDHRMSPLASSSRHGRRHLLASASVTQKPSRPRRWAAPARDAGRRPARLNFATQTGGPFRHRHRSRAPIRSGEPEAAPAPARLTSNGYAAPAFVTPTIVRASRTSTSSRRSLPASRAHDRLPTIFRRLGSRSSDRLGRAQPPCRLPGRRRLASCPTVQPRGTGATARIARRPLAGDTCTVLARPDRAAAYAMCRVPVATLPAPRPFVDACVNRCLGPLTRTDRVPAPRPRRLVQPADRGRIEPEHLVQDLVGVLADAAVPAGRRCALHGPRAPASLRPGDGRCPPSPFVPTRDWRARRADRRGRARASCGRGPSRRDARPGRRAPRRRSAARTRRPPAARSARGPRNDPPRVRSRAPCAPAAPRSRARCRRPSPARSIGRTKSPPPSRACRPRVPKSRPNAP